MTSDCITLTLLNFINVLVSRRGINFVPKTLNFNDTSDIIHVIHLNKVSFSFLVYSMIEESCIFYNWLPCDNGPGGLSLYGTINYMDGPFVMTGC